MYVQIEEQRTFWNKVESSGYVVSWKGNLTALAQRQMLNSMCSDFLYQSPHLSNPMLPSCWEDITLKGTHTATNSNFHPTTCLCIFIIGLITLGGIRCFPPGLSLWLCYNPISPFTRPGSGRSLTVSWSQSVAKGQHSLHKEPTTCFLAFGFC